MEEVEKTDLSDPFDALLPADIKKACKWALW